MGRPCLIHVLAAPVLHVTSRTPHASSTWRFGQGTPKVGGTVSVFVKAGRATHHQVAALAQGETGGGCLQAPSCVAGVSSGR